MFNRSSPISRTGALSPNRWRKRFAVLLVLIVALSGAAYATRCSLLLKAVRLALNHDSGLISQERADGVAIVFRNPPGAWIMPMKNKMNEIWDPIKADGINYYMFAGPRNWLRSYSERSNPNSPYYQAWVGAYVIKRRDGSLPEDLTAWAWQVTGLDQRSWLSAMGDPNPIAESSVATLVGNIEIAGHVRPLWHGIMKSHSDLSDHASGPLVTLVGMPPQSQWPEGLRSFHDVSLDGYFACWVDTRSRVSIVVYAVAASYANQATVTENDATRLSDELLALMTSAKVESLN